MESSVPAVLVRLAQSNVSVLWRDGKAVFRAAAAPPADIIALIEARKADISTFLCAEAVQRRLDAKADVLRAERPSDVSDAHWATALRGLRAFLAAGHGDEVERLGWPRDELYRVPSLWSRVDLCGVALLIGDCEVIEVTAAAIKVRTASGAIQAFYRKPAIDYALAYRTRLKMAGEDGLREEPRLRALEAVTNLYLSNNPDSTVDQAVAAVRTAISSAKESP
jgi:hypothetical protein